MKLNFVAIATALILSGAVISPSLAATTSAPAMTSAAKPAKPAMAAHKAPDPQRFTTEAAAQASCSADTVVWVNLHSKIFHLKGTATYGKGKNGVYMCQTAATGEGFRATKKPEKQVSSK